MMKYHVLWINNILPEEPANILGVKSSPMGGWLMSMADEIAKYDLTLAISSPGPVDKVKKIVGEKYSYYIIPQKYNKKINYWKQIIEDFKPDIIHLNGTEFNYTNNIFDVIKTEKIVLSIQGLISEYWKYYYGMLTANDIIKNLTIKDILRRSDMFHVRKNMKKDGEYEIYKLKKADIIIGRTEWDYAACIRNGVEKKYRSVNENLRSVFYKKRWQFESCKKHRIFCSQGAVPYKGIHILFEALSILKRKYPDVELVIAGYDLIDEKSIWDKIKKSGYAQYLKKVIIKHNLSSNIRFTGLLDENEMCDQYLNANVFVQSSFIENSPNSLGEAISVGMPIVASLVGGTEKYIEHKRDGLLYPAGDCNMLALYISNIFENITLAKSFADNVYNRRNEFYDREINAKKLIDIYNELIK